MNDKQVYTVRLNEKLKLRGLTSEMIETQAEREGLSINDFIGVCVLSYCKPSDDYKSLLNRILRMSSPDDVKDLEVKLGVKLAEKHGLSY